jgi:hypothetical protein
MKNYPAIEEDILWEEDDDSMQIDADERKDYERRVRAKVRNLKHQRNVINGNIFQKNLEIILNHQPSKEGLLLKELNKIVKDSNNLDSYINTLERKIELSFNHYLNLYLYLYLNLNQNLILNLNLNLNLNQNL